MKNQEIHFKYVISYLLFIIVLLIALAFYDVPNLVDKFSFALTLSSLLLAILAIFYTIVSAHKQDSQFSKLIETNSDLKAASSEMKLVSHGINNLLSDVPKHLKKIDSKLDSIDKKYVSPSCDSTDSEDISNNNHEIEITEQLLRQMICKLQYAAMGVLYLFTLSHNKDKNIEYPIISDLDLISLDYVVGVLNGLATTGILEFKLHKEGIMPTQCNPLLIDNINTILKAIIKVGKNEQTKKLEKTMHNIEELFI